MNEENDDRVLLAEAVTGKMVEDFMRSDIGRILIGMNEQDRTLALRQLARVSPWRRRRIQQLQSDVRFCDTFEERLRVLLQRGASAQQELESREQDNATTTED